MDEYIKKLKLLLENSDYEEEYKRKCIEYAERLLLNGLPVIYDLEHLILVLGIKKKILTKMIFAYHNFYSTVEIPKKSGGSRKLQIPSVELKYIQRWILDNILKKIKISKHAIGFCNEKSIVDNAKIHIGNKCILNMDIKDFFPSINFEMVFRIFIYYGYTKELSFIFTRLCTYDGFLPQGSPTSPYISNIVSLKIDKRLSRLAEKYHANYSRYADDITFSSNSSMKKLPEIIQKILLEEGFMVNKKKTRFQYFYQRQEVTGLIVNNGRVRVKKSYKKELYQTIYYCQKFGVNNHLEKINCHKNFYKEYLYGKAYFINMVEPEEGKKIFKLLEEIQWDY